jgi:hypothetical protein
MSESMKFFLLGIILSIAAFAILMPYYARDGRPTGLLPGVTLPYYAHGGRAYKPGVLY